jgi:aminopeptidase N
MILRQPLRRTPLLPLIVLAALVSSRALAQPLFDVNFGGARSHPFDLLNVAIDLRLDDAHREISGNVTHTLRSLASSLRTIRLDAASNMKIGAVTVDGTPVRFRLQVDSLWIYLNKPLGYGDSARLRVDYSVSPRKGLYFIQPDSVFTERRSQIWTQGEAEDNHFWVPIYDYPNDRATTEIRATVRGDWKLLSNGVFLSATPNADGTRTWQYRLDKPYSTYLIMLAAGDYLVTRDTVDGIPLEYWTYPDQPERVKPTFGHTPDIIRYLRDLIGVPYPWNKYSQVMISEFMFGGMENTTATTLTDAALVDARGFVDYNPDGLIAHEATHQWFGDLVTDRSWYHLWLHESFATYIASRYRGYRYGDDVFLKDMFDDGQLALDADKSLGRSPVAGTSGTKTNLYQRGARIIHMLNRLVGEETFWRACRRFLNDHAYGLVETNDLKLAFEDAAGINLDWFFNEWIYGAGAPVYQVEYRTSRDSLWLRVKQVQKLDSSTGLFAMPVPVEFYLSNRVQSDTIWVSKDDEIFAFHITERPRFVIFDAGDAMLKTVRFPRTDEELIAQLDAPRMLDRLDAARELGFSGREKSTLLNRSQVMRDHYKREPSAYVRAEIIRAFGSLDSTVAPDVIRMALRDSAVDVRRAAIDLSMRISDVQARAAALRPLLADSSDDVVGATLEVLALTSPDQLRPELARLRGVRGRHDHLAESWLTAVLESKASALVDDVAEYASPKYSRDLRSQALTTLSKLDTVTPASRLAIERGLRDNSIFIRTAAASAVRASYDDTMRQMLQRLSGQLAGDEKANVDRLLREDPKKN